MQASSSLVNVLEDELKRIDLFQSFWDRRIDIESNYIRELEGLVFNVPGPAGSFRDALDALGDLLRIEIDQKMVILSLLRELRGDSPFQFGGLGNTSGANWCTSVAGYFDEKFVDLAKRESELTTQEAIVQKARSTETEVVVQPSYIDEHKSPSIKRLLLGTPRSKHSEITPINVPGSFTRFDYYDRKYRNLLGHYNYTRERYIKESMQRADKLVTDESKAIAMIQTMIGAFADSQSDFASALNKGSTKCRFMANKISPTTEGHNSLIRIQHSISARFGPPHKYKNFWFGRGAYQRSILFGYIPKSNSNNTASEFMMRVFKVLVKYDPLLSLAPSSNNSGDDRYMQHCKLAHDLETCWDPQGIDGGSEVVRLLTTDAQSQGLVLHFLWRTPRSLVCLPKLGFPTTISDIFRSFCDRCNNHRSYSEQRMLSVVLRLLVDASQDETGVKWVWWDQGDRKKCWYRALTWQDEDRTIMDLLPLWVHCIDPIPGKFEFSRKKLESLHESWKQSVDSQPILPNIPSM